MDNRFHGIYRVESARAKWHEYKCGTYFVTICTKDMAHYFGEIDLSKENKSIELTDLGHYAVQCIEEIEKHYRQAHVLRSVVMPNHVHILVSIEENAELGTIVGSFKSAVTRYANEKEIKFCWQPRFHDHIVRNNHEYDLIEEYIQNNVDNWGRDKYAL